MNSFKKHLKSWLILATVLLLGVMAVMGGHFADVATKPFWWNFFIVIQVISILVLVGGWIYLWRTQGKEKERSN